MFLHKVILVLSELIDIHENYSLLLKATHVELILFVFVDFSYSCCLREEDTFYVNIFQVII